MDVLVHRSAAGFGPLNNRIHIVAVAVSQKESIGGGSFNGGCSVSGRSRLASVTVAQPAANRRAKENERTLVVSRFD